MTGHKPFSELTKDFSPERKAKIASLTNQLHEEMTLQELREALDLHQTDLSERLGIKQVAVSRMENRKDIHLSHLKKVIEAMGGELVIMARFPNRSVCINYVALQNNDSSPRHARDGEEF
ncbi:MAG: XRE family transcriptional regulator [Scytonema sp. PMC 1069.18]|nr:XRE family transcriptional regulator [Scytonema sp. PMC 1069.18]MEC4881782.1 XRE family transcriptional regulator [Scytonema sp. PMC 1070.18]